MVDTPSNFDIEVLHCDTIDGGLAENIFVAVEGKYIYITSDPVLGIVV